MSSELCMLSEHNTKKIQGTSADLFGGSAAFGGHS